MYMSNQDKNVEYIFKTIHEMFPDARCELVYHNVFELSVATILSAQTTDKSVNRVTPDLFKTYPTPSDLGNASEEDVRKIIKSIGLSGVKSKNIIAFSKKLATEYNSVVPADFDLLQTFPGVGRKTANVILTEGFNVPRIPVDTHVERVSKRLGLVEESDSVLTTELKLMKLFNQDDWHLAHHLLLFFGRYHCLAQKPNCENCPLKSICHYKNPLR